MKYKEVKIVFILLFLINSKLFSQGNITDTAVEVSCQSYLDTLLQQKVYLFADQKAEFPGGETAMFKFIQSNLKYPFNHPEVSGTVFVEFVVGTDGSIIWKAIRRSVHSTIDQEALRVIDKMPRFIPAMCNDNTVPFLIVIPIKFTMN